MSKYYAQETQIKGILDIQYKNMNNLDNRKIQTKAKHYPHSQKYVNNIGKWEFMFLEQMHCTATFKNNLKCFAKLEKHMLQSCDSISRCIL